MLFVGKFMLNRAPFKPASLNWAPLNIVEINKLCTKRGSQVWGKVQFFWAVTVPILINREDAVTFILGNLSPIF